MQILEAGRSSQRLPTRVMSASSPSRLGAEKPEDQLLAAAGRRALQGAPAATARSGASRNPASAPLEHPPRPSQATQWQAGSQWRCERGFTLLELLVVIVLIGVLSSVISLSATPDP